MGNGAKKAELLRKREMIIQKYNSKLEPLREARRLGEEVDWVAWDEIEKEREIELFSVEQQLFNLGGI